MLRHLCCFKACPRSEELHDDEDIEMALIQRHQIRHESMLRAIPNMPHPRVIETVILQEPSRASGDIWEQPYVFECIPMETFNAMQSNIEPGDNNSPSEPQPQSPPLQSQPQPQPQSPPLPHPQTRAECVRPVQSKITTPSQRQSKIQPTWQYMIAGSRSPRAIDRINGIAAISDSSTDDDDDDDNNDENEDDIKMEIHLPFDRNKLAVPRERYVMFPRETEVVMQQRPQASASDRNQGSENTLPNVYQRIIGSANIKSLFLGGNRDSIGINETITRILQRNECSPHQTQPEAGDFNRNDDMPTTSTAAAAAAASAASASASRGEGYQRIDRATNTGPNLNGGPQPQTISSKVIIVGDNGVGKTTLIMNACYGDKCPKRLQSTIAMDFTNKVVIVEGTRVKLQIWDTAGQERFRSVTHAYYRDAHALLLLYDITSRVSFNNIRAWLAEIRDYAQEDVVIILIGNKADCSGERQVKREEGERLARESGVPFMETSAKTGQNVDLAFSAIARHLKSRGLYNGDDGRFNVHDYLRDNSKSNSLCSNCNAS